MIFVDKYRHTYSCLITQDIYGFIKGGVNTDLHIYCVTCIRAAYRETDIVYRVQYRMACIAR